MTDIIAKVIMASQHPYHDALNLKPLVSFQLRYPRFIHAEFMTHRALSRNASSSRAVPTRVLLHEVRSRELRAQPRFWGKNQSGMQAYEEMDSFNISKGVQAWEQAADAAADYAEILDNLGFHKQIVNRILEPFTHINGVASATEWDNFFGLRLHKAAMPEMRMLAEAMWKEYNEACEKRLQKLTYEQWHTPFVEQFNITTPEEEADARAIEIAAQGSFGGQNYDATDIALMVSVARCARTSYTSYKTARRSTVQEDYELYINTLHLPLPWTLTPSLEPLHASPAEHQGMPDKRIDDKQFLDCGADGWHADWERYPEHGNFKGFVQFRKTLPGEAIAPLPENYVPF